MNEIIDDYLVDLNKIKDTIKNNQNRAMVIVNSAMIMTYYEIGTIINKHKTWGSKYIEKLSNDLKEYGKGYSITNLKRMMIFAKRISFDEISPQVVGQIPWSTIDLIISKAKSHDEMVWYINQAHKNGWSRAMVLNQFELKAYERSLIEPTTTEILKSDDLTKELFKDTYVFDFLDREKIKSEKDLKNQMIDNIIRFLQELGPGFSLVGKEYRLKTPTSEDFYIDLLMYHTKIHAYIVFEIKNRKLMPQDLGQLLFYVNATNNIEKTLDDEETIGILLCKDADTFVAETTLKGINSKINISKYKIIEELPKYLEKRLNLDVKM